jgi:general stress protein 26
MTEQTNDTRKLWSMIKEIGVGMLTSDDAGTLRARPMVAAQKEFDGNLWFFTRVDSGKVAEVRHDSQVCVTYADAGKQDYVSISGTARLVRDQALISEHWSESMRTWFPKGKADPEIALLQVEVTRGEYWDAPNSTMLHLYGYVKAVATGEAPHPGDNQKVRVG